MSKKNILFILIIIATLIIAVMTTIKFQAKEEAILLGDFSKEIVSDENYIFTSYEDYIDKFNSKEISKQDFNKHNYLLIKIQYNSYTEKNIRLVDFKVNKNTININVEYEYKCSYKSSTKYRYFLLPIDKKITTLKVNMDYKQIDYTECDPLEEYFHNSSGHGATLDKPIIYLYPEKIIDVNVKLENTYLLTSTYPKYKDSWNVTANPNGTLIDKNTGRELYGLYWEGKNHTAKVTDEGFVIKGEDSIEFLETALKTLGLNEREANEFIIYWLPELEKSKYNYIRFETMEELNEYMPLTITPAPDTIIRVAMVYKPLDEPINVKEQKLTTPERTGFTVVEWGGTRVQ